MPIITNVQLVDAFRRFLAEGWGYVYGAQGQMWSAELAQKWQAAGRSVPKGRNKETYFIEGCAQSIGRYVADCSGGIVTAIREVDPDYRDQTADTFKARFKQSGPISTIPEVPGVALWRSGHIGVYVGGGKLIEFKGTDYGCVESNLKGSKFTLWGFLADVAYPGELLTKAEEQAPAATPVMRPEPRTLMLADPMMKGDDVLALQAALEARGFDLGTIDGTFGPKTEAAVIAFKMRYLLDVDGSVGPQTRKELRL